MARCQQEDRATVLKLLKESCIMQQQFPEAARLRDLETAARKKGAGSRDGRKGSDGKKGGGK
jgi:hypothetical protein